METAIGYIRVSSDDQAREGLSLEAQERNIKAYCELKNYHLVTIFKDEGVSGFTPLEKRPGGSLALLKLGLINKHPQSQKKDSSKTKLSKKLSIKEDDSFPDVTNFVAIKLDRVFRNTGDAITKSQEFQKNGINLHLLDVSVDTSTATGKMFFTVLAMLAQFERDITGERTKTVLDMKRKDGKVWNHTPFGFDRFGDLLAPNHNEQNAITMMKKMRNQGLSYRDIGYELELQGIPPKTGGKAWQAMTVKKILDRKEL
jgi:DNA invertase Pin-like site-specific DNA recombinase